MWATFTLIAATALLSACSWSGGSEESTPVVLVGDSLAAEAAEYLPGLLGGAPLVGRYFGGTAPCDWLDDDLGATAGSVVVISFSGNSKTPCMSDGAGDYLQDGALVEKYRADVSVLIERAQSAGASVELVGQPVPAPTGPGAGLVELLNGMYQELAVSTGATFVDAGKSVENADGSFAQRLPCVPEEPQCDPSGENVVRSDDGVHFCPRPAAPGECAEHSSGAFRFAAAIADAVDDVADR